MKNSKIKYLWILMTICCLLYPPYHMKYKVGTSYDFRDIGYHWLLWPPTKGTINITTLCIEIIISTVICFAIYEILKNKATPAFFSLSFYKKNKKKCFAIFILAIAAGIGYYNAVYIPQQHAKIAAEKEKKEYQEKVRKNMLEAELNSMELEHQKKEQEKQEAAERAAEIQKNMEESQRKFNEEMDRLQKENEQKLEELNKSIKNNNKDVINYGYIENGGTTKSYHNTQLPPGYYNTSTLPDSALHSPEQIMEDLL